MIGDWDRDWGTGLEIVDSDLDWYRGLVLWIGIGDC